MIKRIRLGIDVGGTFTKAVAIDVLQSKIVGKATVPTTHSTVEGVSTGILAALTRVIQENNIEKSEIELISHSTTQAVNALLEGDTSKIGIIGMGVGLEKANIVKHTDLKDIELSPNKHLRICCPERED
jgi:N-methylhydantoinase A